MLSTHVKVVEIHAFDLCISDLSRAHWKARSIAGVTQCLRFKHENQGPIHTGRRAHCNMHMQIMEHTVVNGSVHTGCMQHQRVCVQICLRVLCERGPRMFIYPHCKISSLSLFFSLFLPLPTTSVSLSFLQSPSLRVYANLLPFLLVSVFVLVFSFSLSFSIAWFC